MRDVSVSSVNDILLILAKGLCFLIQNQHSYKHKWLTGYNRVVLLSSFRNYTITYVCVVFSSRSFWTSSSLDVPAGATQEEGHTGFLIHFLSAVRALIFLAIRIQSFLSLVDREVEFCVLTI